MLDHVAHEHGVRLPLGQVGLEQLRGDHLEAKLVAGIARRELARLDPERAPAALPRLRQQEPDPAAEVHEQRRLLGFASGAAAVALDPVEDGAGGLTLALLLDHVVLRLRLGIALRELGLGRHPLELHVTAAAAPDDVGERLTEAVGRRGQPLFARLAGDREVRLERPGAAGGALHSVGHRVPIIAVDMDTGPTGTTTAIADGGRQLRLLSVVAPVYNEEDGIREFSTRVASALGDLPFELILVDDGSSDGTGGVLADLAASDPRIRVITLSRNFGHQAALTAGLDHAQGEATVMMDSDLQDPPEVVPQLLDRWRAGAEIVYAVRGQRTGETRFKLTTARWFYRLFNRLTKIDLPPEAGDFRLLDRRALDALLEMRERSRFLRGMTAWVGFDQERVIYERDARFAGETKYTPARMVRLSVDAISSFSSLPLQAATLFGFLFSIVAFLGIPVAIGFRVAGEFVPGITTVLFVVLLLGGIQLITVGIIGEYLGRVYDEVKRRPLYVVRSRTNAEAPAHLRGSTEDPAEVPRIELERRE